MRELRRKNDDLQREKDEGEKERERMRRCIEQLRAKLAQAQVEQSNTSDTYRLYPKIKCSNVVTQMGRTDMLLLEGNLVCPKALVFGK